MSKQDQLESEAYLLLRVSRTKLGVFYSRHKTEADALIEHGLVELVEDKLSLTPKGEDVVEALNAALLDTYKTQTHT